MVVYNLGLGTAVRFKMYTYVVACTLIPSAIRILVHHARSPHVHEKRFAPALGAQGSRLSPAN